jgi:23S rRNA (adenine1618-N6)-methyltransferase
VKINGLEDRIRIVAKTSDDAHILPLEACGIETVDFVMTNPPFYDSEDEMITSARKKTHPPNSACTGASVEMVVDGGEMAFVGRILQESLDLRERVRWYTSMFGKLSSVYEFVERLRQNGIGNYAVTAFVQGKKTKRWAVGWSFGAMRPSDKASRGIKSTLSKSVLPPVVEMDVCTVMTDHGISPLTDRIGQVIGSLELSSWVWDKEKLRGIGRASENVWGRAWRRKKKRREESADIAVSLEHRDEDAPCRFAFLVSIRVSRSEATVGLRWLEGRESVLFESFCGFLKAQIEATV